MALNAKNFGLAGGIIWGAGMLITTLISQATGWAAGFLNIMATVYPGYTISGVGSIVGFVYGFIDAFIGLYIFAWLYNWLGRRK